MMGGPRRHQLKDRLIIIILHIVLRIAQQNYGKGIRIAQMLLVGINLCPKLEECKQASQTKNDSVFHDCVLN
jgi:hypothetical protein